MIGNQKGRLNNRTEMELLAVKRSVILENKHF